MSSFGIYLIGFIVVIVGLAIAAYMLGAPPIWIAIGAGVMHPAPCWKLEPEPQRFAPTPLRASVTMRSCSTAWTSAKPSAGLARSGRPT